MLTNTTTDFIGQALDAAQTARSVIDDMRRAAHREGAPAADVHDLDVLSYAVNVAIGDLIGFDYREHLSAPVAR